MKFRRDGLKALVLYAIALRWLLVLPCFAQEPHIAVVRMDMMILPGTASYLESSIVQAHESGAKALVVVLDTPGGMLHTTREMVKTIFEAPIPVIIYVGPSGSTAASAGAFITLAGHVAAMAPGTSIGAAHPVDSSGGNIEGDMRTKIENDTVSLVKTISEQRGRNVEWAEKSVKESNSLTSDEALKMSVIDVLATDIDDLLRQIKGKEVKLHGGKFTFEDYSKLPRRELDMSITHKSLNILGNPNVLALLWLGATTGLSLELYNPGAILPGVVGVICLVLALLVSQSIPISQGAVLLLIVGALLIGAEFFVPSGILGVGGIIAMVLGAMYLIDVAKAPGVGVEMALIIPVALLAGAIVLGAVYLAIHAMKQKVTTGLEGLIGQIGKAMSTITSKGKVFVNGELWNAVVSQGIIEKGTDVKIVAVREGLVLEVENVQTKTVQQ